MLVAWHIDQGSFGQVTLDGLNVVLAVHSPGNMVEVQWKVALYLDEKASDAQKDVLTKVFAGQAGGHFARLASHIGEVLGVSSVAIEYKADGKQRSLRIPNLAEMQISAIDGAGGTQVSITNNPLGIVPGEPMTVAKSSKLTYDDHGMKWELSNKNGFYSPFAYQGP